MLDGTCIAFGRTGDTYLLAKLDQPEVTFSQGPSGRSFLQVLSCLSLRFSDRQTGPVAQPMDVGIDGDRVDIECKLQYDISHLRPIPGSCNNSLRESGTTPSKSVSKVLQNL